MVNGLEHAPTLKGADAFARTHNSQALGISYTFPSRRLPPTVLAVCLLRALASVSHEPHRQ